MTRKTHGASRTWRLSGSVGVLWFFSESVDVEVHAYPTLEPENSGASRRYRAHIRHVLFREGEESWRDSCQILAGLESLESVILEHYDLSVYRKFDVSHDPQSVAPEKVHHRTYHQAHALALEAKRGRLSANVPVSPFWCLKKYSVSWKER